MFAWIVNLLSTRGADLKADYKPMVPPPEGWRGEPWLHAANVEAYLESTKRSIPIGLVALAAGFALIGLLMNALLASSMLWIVVSLPLVFQPIFLCSNAYGRMRRPYFPANSFFFIQRDQIYAAVYASIILLGIVFILPIIGLFTGLVLVALAAPIITLAGKHVMPTLSDAPLCARCGYDVSTIDMLEHCPECGTHLVTPETITHLRKPEGNINLIWWIMPLVPASLFVSGLGGPLTTSITPILPTPILLWLGPEDADYLHELDQRQLTQAQHDRLNERVVDHVLNALWTDTDIRRWVADRIINGAVDPDLADRYFTSLIDVSFDAPKTARVGEPVPLSFEIDSDILGSTLSYGVFSTGLSIDNEPPQTLINEDRDIATEAFSVYEFNPTFTVGHHTGSKPSLLMRSQDRKRVRPAITHTFDHPGTITLTTTVVVIAPVYFPQTITWHDDNTYTITPQPLWHEKRTLTHTIEVVQ